MMTGEEVTVRSRIFTFLRSSRLQLHNAIETRWRSRRPTR